MEQITPAKYKLGTSASGRVGKQTDEGKNEHFGIYQTININGEQRVIKRPFYKPRNPRTALQQLNRDTFKNACIQWQALDEPTKKVWREKAKGKPLYGFNLFVKWFMKK